MQQTDDTTQSERSPERSPESRDEFARWLRTQHAPAHARRTAQRNAAFLLPHLRPGMTLLDCGCGPGSITVGLAEAVAPGDAPGAVTGIDVSAEAVEAARARAAEAGCANARFEVADVYELPYPDATFDAAFLHAVLQHLADPLAALKEVRRVMKPGGVIGVGDADDLGSVMWPESPAIERSNALMARLRCERDGSRRDVGRRLRTLLHDAGFPRNAGSVIADADAAKESAQRTGEWQAAYFEAPPFVARVTALGFATEDELREMSAAWRAWGRDPGAFWARFWFQAVGWAE